MIRIAIAGAGAIGTVHARNIAAHPDCTLSHVIDLDAERTERLSGRFGGKTGSTIETATRDEEVDAVIIVSSTAAHTEQVLACTNTQMHFLCE